MPAKFSIVRGNIALQEIDVIVTAANHALAGGAGVDGAVHKAAGPELLAECRRIAGCPTGGAVVTGAYDLAAKFVVHAVGPVWDGGTRNEDELLADCYRNALRLAAGKGARSIAFPAISTGTYGFPFERAASIALRALVEEVLKQPTVEEVRLVCFGAAALAMMERVAAREGISIGQPAGTLPRNPD